MYLNEFHVPTLDTANSRLTLTWDVFKFIILPQFPQVIVRLTLTWDVFKYLRYNLLTSKLLRLTLTWDVFKFYRYRTIKKVIHMINFNMRCI